MREEVTHRDALPPGTRLREFELLEVLGRGGFGVTYRGLDLNLDISVAIKEYMPSEFAVREPNGDVYPKTHQTEEWYAWGLERFLYEAKMLARFNHPGIVRVLRYFEGHGTAYIVMEYLEGQTLYALYEQQKTLSEVRLRALLAPVLAGLEQVHAAGYLHRDIKPGNIVLRDEDTPVLIDFGAAQALTVEHSRTVASFEMPGFSPIEQYSVTTQNYGPWTDLYAVGAVLYRGMTGMVPLDALSRIEQDGLEPVGHVAKHDYSRQLTAAVDWALKLRAADRPQSIGQWRDVLEGRALPPGGASSAPHRGDARQHRGRALPPGEDSSTRFPIHRLAALVMVTILLLAGGASLWWMKPPAPVSHVEPLPGPPIGPPVDSSLDQKVAEVRELHEQGNFAEARRRLEEARALGLDGELYRVFLAAIDETEAGAALESEPEPQVTESPVQPVPGGSEAVQSLSGCREFKSARRWKEALECVRRVKGLDPGNTEAIDEERELDMLVVFSRVHESPSVEGYFGFIVGYAWSPFVDVAKEGLKELENEYWDEVTATDTREGYERYLEIYPRGRHAGEARRRLSG